MQTIDSITDLKEKVDHTNSNEIILDVRSPSEFAAGHIPSAVNTITTDIHIISNIQKLDPSKTYIVYCQSGGRSQIVSLLMEKSGLTVINSRVGFVDWSNAGYTIEY